MTASLLGLIAAIIAGLFCGAALTAIAGRIRQAFSLKSPPVELTARQILLKKGEPAPPPRLWQRLRGKQASTEPDWQAVESLVLELRQDGKRALEVLLLDMTPKQLEHLRAKLRKVRPQQAAGKTR